MRYNDFPLLLSGLLLGTATLTAQAAPVDLNTWTAESYDSVSGFGDGEWNVTADGSSVNQSVNGQPTLFYSDFDAFGTEVRGSLQVGSTSDDDFIGFVLGYQPGDTTNTAADYLLVDWKRTDQFFNFSGSSTSPGGTAQRGLAVSRVTGVPDADEFWQHDNLSGTPVGSGLDELARGSTLGGTGWDIGVSYDFTFDFGPNNLQVYVDDVLELDITGSFANGRMGFYNFSQNNVNYSAFELEQGSFPEEPVTVPEPTSLLLILMGLLGLSVRWLAQKPQEN